MAENDFTQIRKDVYKDLSRNTIIIILIFIIFRFVILPLLPDPIPSFWNYIINFVFDVLYNIKCFLLYG